MANNTAENVKDFEQETVHVLVTGFYASVRRHALVRCSCLIFGHFPSPRSHGVEKTANELVAGQKLEKKVRVAFLQYLPVSSVT